MKQINLQENLRKKFIKQGVKMVAPDTVFFSKDTKIGKNVSIEPYVVIGKKVKILNNVVIHSFSHLENTKIETNVKVGQNISTGTKIGLVFSNEFDESGILDFQIWRGLEKINPMNWLKE